MNPALASLESLFRVATYITKPIVPKQTEDQKSIPCFLKKQSISFHNCVKKMANLSI
jgi:hypothetical protein